jgi:hypothetical protein
VILMHPVLRPQHKQTEQLTMADTTPATAPATTSVAHSSSGRSAESHRVKQRLMQKQAEIIMHPEAAAAAADDG